MRQGSCSSGRTPTALPGGAVCGSSPRRAPARRMGTVATELFAIAGLTAAAFAALVLSQRPSSTAVTYWLTALISAGALINGFVALLVGVPPSDLVLPLGLPWLGAHFHLDQLAAFFLVVVNLGGTLASLFALGYGKHESSPHRVLPFFACFLAGMNLVVVAADAFRS